MIKILFKKRESKRIALALLVGVSITTPTLNIVYAIDNNQNLEMHIEEKEDEYKKQFQKIHGSEDIYKLYLKTDEIKAEVNGARGIIRITKIDSNSYKFREVIEINAFEGFKDAITEENKMNTFVNRPGAWKTQGPDKANLRVVKGSPRDTLYAYNPSIFNTNGERKKYTKPTNNWYSGYTKGYYDSIQKARRSIGTAKSSFSKGNEYFVTAVAIQFLKKEVFKIKSNEFLVALKIMYLGATPLEYFNAARYGAAYIINMGEVMLNYNKL